MIFNASENGQIGDLENRDTYTACELLVALSIF